MNIGTIFDAYESRGINTYLQDGEDASTCFKKLVELDKRTPTTRTTLHDGERVVREDERVVLDGNNSYGYEKTQMYEKTLADLTDEEIEIIRGNKASAIERKFKQKSGIANMVAYVKTAFVRLFGNLLYFIAWFGAKWYGSPEKRAREAEEAEQYEKDKEVKRQAKEKKKEEDYNRWLQSAHVLNINGKKKYTKFTEKQNLKINKVKQAKGDEAAINVALRMRSRNQDKTMFKILLIAMGGIFLYSFVVTEILPHIGTIGMMALGITVFVLTGTVLAHTLGKRWYDEDSNLRPNLEKMRKYGATKKEITKGEVGSITEYDVMKYLPRKLRVVPIEERPERRVRTAEEIEALGLIFDSGDCDYWDKSVDLEESLTDEESIRVDGSIERVAGVKHEKVEMYEKKLSDLTEEELDIVRQNKQRHLNRQYKSSSANAARSAGFKTFLLHAFAYIVRGIILVFDVLYNILFEFPRKHKGAIRKVFKWMKNKLKEEENAEKESIRRRAKSEEDYQRVLTDRKFHRLGIATALIVIFGYFGYALLPYLIVDTYRSVTSSKDTILLVVGVIAGVLITVFIVRKFLCTKVGEQFEKNIADMTGKEISAREVIKGEVGDLTDGDVKKYLPKNLRLVPLDVWMGEREDTEMEVASTSEDSSDIAE